MDEYPVRAFVATGTFDLLDSDEGVLMIENDRLGLTFREVFDERDVCAGHTRRSTAWAFRAS